MARQTRSDCTVGTFEKKNGLPPGTIRNKDGRDTRSDKLIGTIRREGEKKGGQRKSLDRTVSIGFTPSSAVHRRSRCTAQAPDKLPGA